jgi:parvulin-like peptidyl-prolyl isomerase
MGRSASAQNEPAAKSPPAPGQPAQNPPAAQPTAAAAQPRDKPADPSKVVLTVGDEKVTVGEIEALISDLPQAQQQLLRRAGKRMLAEELVRIKLFSQEAKKRKLDQQDKVKRQLNLTQDQILAGALASDVLRQSYEANKKQFEKIHARHILIRTPGSRAPVRPGQKELTEEQAKAKADDLRKQLVGGADFAELARKESDDTVSGAQGGDLGTFGHGEMVPEFDAAAFALKEGEISQPVKTPFGYHVIQAQDILSFDELQQDIAGQSNPQIQKLVDDLRKGSDVQLDESYFGPMPATPALPGQPGAPGAAPAPQGGAATPPGAAGQPK